MKKIQLFEFFSWKGICLRRDMLNISTTENLLFRKLQTLLFFFNDDPFSDAENPLLSQRFTETTWLS